MRKFIINNQMLFEKISNGSLNADDMEHDYLKMIDHWKQIYLRRETSS